MPVQITASRLQYWPSELNQSSRCYTNQQTLSQWPHSHHQRLRSNTVLLAYPTCTWNESVCSTNSLSFRCYKYKLLYVAPAWWGFSTSTDRNRVLLVLLTVEHVAGFCAADHTDISEMVVDAEDKLFHKILNDASHVLSQLLSERRNELTYSVRTRRHGRTLSQRHH